VLSLTVSTVTTIQSHRKKVSMEANPPNVTTHLVTIGFNDKRGTWLAECDKKDFTQSYLNRSEAHIASHKHIDDVMILNELERGTYEFDDGR